MPELIWRSFIGVPMGMLSTGMESNQLLREKQLNL
jgi:hypothetical protein